MTRPEFEELMTTDRWTREQRSLWQNLTPVSDADAFRREMARPDGLIEFKRVGDESLGSLFWKRIYKKRSAS